MYYKITNRFAQNPTIPTIDNKHNEQHIWPYFTTSLNETGVNKLISKFGIEKRYIESFIFWLDAFYCMSDLPLSMCSTPRTVSVFLFKLLWQVKTRSSLRAQHSNMLCEERETVYSNVKHSIQGRSKAEKNPVSRRWSPAISDAMYVYPTNQRRWSDNLPFGVDYNWDNWDLNGILNFRYSSYF